MQVKDRNRNRRSIGTLALVSLFCQLGLAPGIALGNGHPNFALVFSGVVALSIGGETGVMSAFFAGLVYDLSSTGPIGLMALFCTIAAFVMGMEVRDRLSEESMLTIIPFSVATLSVCLAYNLAMLLFGQAASFVDAVVFRALPSTPLTIIAYILYVLVIGRSHQGGLRMGVPSTPGRHSSRYTLGNR